MHWPLILLFLVLIGIGITAIFQFNYVDPNLYCQTKYLKDQRRKKPKSVLISFEAYKISSLVMYAVIGFVLFLAAWYQTPNLVAFSQFLTVSMLTVIIWFTVTSGMSYAVMRDENINDEGSLSAQTITGWIVFGQLIILLILCINLFSCKVTLSNMSNTPFNISSAFDKFSSVPINEVLNTS